MWRLRGVLVWLSAARVGAVEECSWCGASGAGCTARAEVVKGGVWLSGVSGAAGGRRYPYWRPKGQVELGERTKVTTVVVVQHGSARNGDEYTSWMSDAAKMAGLSRDEALIFGTQFYFESDAGLDVATEMWWDDSESAESNWRWGGESTAELDGRISSFGVLDAIFAIVQRAAPYLERVILAGHSAGGQLVQRYALFSTWPHEKNSATRFFAANPSTVTYLDSRRPILGPRDCAACDNLTIARTRFQFAVPLDACHGFDDYGYGLRNASSPPYVASQDVQNAVDRYLRRRVTYVAGESDVCDSVYDTIHRCDDGCVSNDHDMDRSCQAEAQGFCRFQRTTAFSQLVARLTDAHAYLPVPYVGHNACGIFQSPQFLEAAFATQPNLLEHEEAASSTQSPPHVLVEDEDEDFASYSWFCSPSRAPYCSDASLETTTEDGENGTLPGNVLMGGGTDVDAAFEWQIARGGCGNFLVLRESGTDAYDPYVRRLGRSKVSAAATLILNRKAAADDAFVLAKVRAADAVFFAGGDQSKYVERISGTRLETLLRAKAANITIGGTSAGNAIQGPFVYAGAHGSATSTEALQNPYARTVDLVDGFLDSPPLVATTVVMDDHFVTRDRMGRMLAFMARIANDDGLCAGLCPTVGGIGVDEATALLVDQRGRAVLVGNSTAYACRAPPPTLCEPHTPLTMTNISCHRLQPGDTFDIYAWSGSGTDYRLNIVNGAIIGHPYGPPSSSFELHDAAGPS